MYTSGIVPHSQGVEKVKIYALYKGDEFICDGTTHEIAEFTGKTLDYIQFMTYPSYQKRLSKANNNRLTMILLSDEGEEE